MGAAVESLAEFGCSDGRLLATGTRTDDDEIVLAHGWAHVHLPLILNDALHAHV